MWNYLFNPSKREYVKGKKPQVPCILCAVRDGDPSVTNLEVARKGGFIVSVNLYPFNPGHVMLFPERHVESLQDLTEDEVLALHRLTCETLAVLREEFSPVGFNAGYNIGGGSGASIPHLHLQVVPRFGNEPGFLEVLAGTRVIIADPVEMRDRLKKRFSDG